MDFQHGIVRGYTLERDIGMPASTGKPSNIAELMRETAAFLLLLAADDADLIPELTAGFSQWMHMKTG